MSWEDNWNKFLQEHKLEPVDPEIPDGALHLNLADVDFYIPPLLGTTTESMKAIARHNAKIGIF